VRDGSHAPMTVSGPRTVTATSSSPPDAVTTVRCRAPRPTRALPGSPWDWTLPMGLARGRGCAQSDGRRRGLEGALPATHGRG
jgi:hypothetical protein